MAEEKAKSSEKSSSGLPKILLIGCVGCLGLLIIAGIVFGVAGKFIMSKLGQGALEKVIEGKTGIDANLSDLEKGKLTIKDEKTGTSIDIGSGKLPEGFPKDFPVYPGAKVTSAYSGQDRGEDSSGFWVTLTTGDATSKVEAYYKDKLAAGGWKTTSTYSSGDSASYTVEKGELSGTVTVAKSDDATEVVIILGKN